MLYTKILPPSFQRSTLESSYSSALFVSLLYQKQNKLQTPPATSSSRLYQTQVKMSSNNYRSNTIVTM